MEEFSRAIARTATAQIAYATGFDSIQESANEALAEIMLKFMAEIGACAHTHCEVAGRTTPNILDVLVAFEDLGVSLQDLMDYAKPETDIPFEHSLPSYPVKVPSRWKPTFEQVKENAPAHIPSFYPALPDAHTYKDTPLYVGHDRDKLRQRDKLDKKRETGEQTLLSLENRTKAATAAAAAAAAAGTKAPAASPSKPGTAPQKLARNLFHARRAGMDAAKARGDAPRGDREHDQNKKPSAADGGSRAVIMPAGDGGKPPGNPEERLPNPDAGPNGASGAAGWRQASPAGGDELAGRTGPPIAFELGNRGRVRARETITQLALEDSFAHTGEEEDTGHRKHKHKSKHRKHREEDPAVIHAETLLEAGEDAMALEEKEAL